MKQPGLFDAVTDPTGAEPVHEPVHEPVNETGLESEPGDARDRRLAVRVFDRPVFLEAGAGTGKTAILVARIIAWCTGPGWDETRERSSEAAPEEIALATLRGVVAITFTEAAAAEMASRIGKALAHLQRVASPTSSTSAELADEDLPIGLERADLPARTADVFERARALRAALDSLNASTIHAFCRRLLSAHPLELGLDPAFQLDTGAGIEIVVREVLEDYLREAWSDPVDPELLGLARDGFGPPELEEVLIGLILDQGARARDFAADPYDEETCARLRGDLEQGLDELAQLTACLDGITRAEVTQSTVDALTRTRELLQQSTGVNLADIESLCTTLAPAWPDKLRRRLKDWAKGKLNKGEEKQAGETKDELILAAESFLLALAPFLEMRPAFLQRARGILCALLNRVEAELRRRGLSTFNDLLCDARGLLMDNPEIAGLERGRIRQLLVDEFQDTDALQCEIVRHIGLEGDERPGLFVVGDPKQSIYAWRNADLAAYEAFADDMETAGGVRLSLTRNFRSVPAVLDEVERAIAPVMEKVADTQPAFVPLQPYRTSTDAGPEIEYWVSWPRAADGSVQPEIGLRRQPSYRSEARALARDLVQRRQDQPELTWKDFGVLFRSTTELETYLFELRQLGIPYEVQSDKNYYRRREVIDVTALVRCVLDPNDHLALVTLIRSPMVGTPDAALLPLWEAGFPGEMSWLREPREQQLEKLATLIRAAVKRVPPSVPGLAAIAGWEESLVAAVGALATARSSFHEDPADRWIERLRQLFLPEVIEAARFLGGYRLANVQRFFRELLRALEERSGDTQSVLRTLRANLARERELESSRPADSGQDAVQVMTMHGAKGLEFRHVYLAHLHRPGRVDSDGRTDFDKRGEHVSYRLFGVPCPNYFATKHDRDRAEDAERVRLLYVAMTRAEERLVLLGGWTTSPKRKNWRRANTFAELLESRPGSEAAVALLARRAVQADHEPVLDESGVRWILSEAVANDVEAPTSDPVRVTPPAIEEVAAAAETLAAARAHARGRSLRPFAKAASADAHGSTLEQAQASAERRFAEEGAEAPGTASIGRDAAQAAGTAVHRVLERLELSADLEAELERLQPELDESLAHLDPKGADQARARAAELLQLARENGILQKLAELSEHVVARELQVLLPPPSSEEEGDAVGFVSGAIDLVYRDPETSALVIADYKTDDVTSDEEILARAETYRPQGAVYTRALRDALGLEATPRFELWFLRAGRVEVV